MLYNIKPQVNVLRFTKTELVYKNLVDFYNVQNRVNFFFAKELQQTESVLCVLSQFLQSTKTESIFAW